MTFLTLEQQAMLIFLATSDPPRPSRTIRRFLQESGGNGSLAELEEQIRLANESSDALSLAAQFVELTDADWAIIEAIENVDNIRARLIKEAAKQRLSVDEIANQSGLDVEPLTHYLNEQVDDADNLTMLQVCQLAASFGLEMSFRRNH